jgi:cytochrome c peroxidase
MKKKRLGASGVTAVVALLSASASVSAMAHGAHGPTPPPRVPDQQDFIPEVFTPIRNLQPFPNASGALATYNVAGRIDTRNPFFKSLGTNGRSCATCHMPSQAFSISPPDIRERFARTRGRDPLFASVDGANCETARRSDPADHSLLLKHGLIRVAIALPANAQFTIRAVHDPYGCALLPDPKTGQLNVSVYRRPLPSTNVSFLSTVMWDGRETLSPLNNGSTFLANLHANLAHQVLSAVSGHAQGAVPPSDGDVAAIVAFESGLFTAQAWDWRAGDLDGHGGLGGPKVLSNQLYYPGINDTLGGDPTGTAFSSASMTNFDAWGEDGGRWRDHNYQRASIAAGEKLFNTAPLTITTVRGLNDSASLNEPVTIQGTCTTCHDTPNVGHHSMPLPLDIGVAHVAMPGLEKDPNIAAAVGELDEPDLPVYLISGCPDPFEGHPRTSFYTTDPGKALITGQCSDLNRLKGPILRGLAGRAPYFHNGAAKTLAQAVNFYNERFKMNLTREQKEDLVAFLNSL